MSLEGGTIVSDTIGVSGSARSEEEAVEEQTAPLIDSILTSVKKNLNISAEEKAFDADLVFHINSVFAELYQLGVGPSTPFMIEDESTTWDEFTTDASLAMVKSYMYLDVRMMFDPPTASLLTAMKEKRDEYEWRLNVAGDSPIDRSEDQNGSV